MEATNQVPQPRIPLQVHVEFRKNYARNMTKGLLRNVSLSGAFLSTSTHDVEAQDKLVLEIKLSGRRRKLHATVVWKNHSGCGLKFHHSNNRDLQIIDDLMWFVETKRSNNRNLLDSILKKVS